MTTASTPAPVCGQPGDLSPTAQVGALLLCTDRPLKERFRALFTLKAIGGEDAVQWMGRAFTDESALLKHEVAYCLGQLGSPLALPILTAVLADMQGQEPIVRHEAAEALAAIGGEEALSWVTKYSQDPVQEVRETCELALAKLSLCEEESLGNVWGSHDPAPPSKEKDPVKLRIALLDESLPLFDRYRAMFSLRNIGDEQSIIALADSLTCTSALFRHEVAFVLGQTASPLAAEKLLERLRDEQENPMVRHECAEALGDIPGVDILTEMNAYLDPKVDPVIRESCVIALDMADYNSSKEFQYANGLVNLATTA